MAEAASGASPASKKQKVRGGLTTRSRPSLPGWPGRCWLAGGQAGWPGSTTHGTDSVASRRVGSPLRGMPTPVPSPPLPFPRHRPRPATGTAATGPRRWSSCRTSRPTPRTRASTSACLLSWIDRAAMLACVYDQPVFTLTHTRTPTTSACLADWPCCVACLRV